jgi:hypothetical protein
MLYSLCYNLLKLLSSGFSLSLRFITLKQFKILSGVIQVFKNSHQSLSPKKDLKDETVRVIEISRQLKIFLKLLNSL